MEKVEKKCDFTSILECAWMDENVVVFTTITIVTFGTTHYFCHLYNNE
jgi:hypothetical protein